MKRVYLRMGFSSENRNNEDGPCPPAALAPPILSAAPAPACCCCTAWAAASCAAANLQHKTHTHCTLPQCCDPVNKPQHVIILFGNCVEQCRIVCWYWENNRRMFGLFGDVWFIGMLCSLLHLQFKHLYRLLALFYNCIFFIKIIEIILKLLWFKIIKW